LVTVITTGAWPVASCSEAYLPPELALQCHQFCEFYCGLHKSRSLTWLTNQGCASLVARCASGEYDVRLSTRQMFALLLFNTRDRASFSEMQTILGISAGELKRTLSCLTQSRLLTQERENVFCYNAGFRSDAHELEVGIPFKLA
jgi:hypothetical protein